MNVEGLQPFTRYLVQVSASNYYNDVTGVFGSAHFFNTSHGSRCILCKQLKNAVCFFIAIYCVNVRNALQIVFVTIFFDDNALGYDIIGCV